MAEYKKPLPIPDPDTKEYWEGCKRHELLLQRCSQCGSYRFPPSPMCHECTSMSFEWTRISGEGRLYSWMVVQYPTHEAFTEDIPYAVAMVEPVEQKGIRLTGSLVDWQSTELRIDMPVEVVFDDVTEEMTLPRWRPLDTDQ